MAGETTCAIAVITGDQVFGASVGDSGVWIIGESKVRDLTQGQMRKPFVGSGTVWPVPFTYERTAGECLLLATDGLLKYSSPDRIAAVCRGQDQDLAARALIELVRYSSGSLPDDVTVILAQL
jgi:PPM family protein phosphatase